MEWQNVDTVWRELIRASADRRHAWRVVTFCTQGANGPSARSVILRKVRLENRTLVFYTDARSAKVAELTAWPKVALLMWDPGHRRQLRLEGLASVEHDDAVVEQHWASVSEAGRQDYASASAPGAVIGAAAPQGVIGAAAPVDIATARRHFTVIKVRMQSMDFLQLEREAHLRWRYDWDEAQGSWTVKPLVP